MKSNYRALSELIEKVDERNDDGAITELIGVSIDKCFIKSVANTNGTDLSKYKIIRKNEFAVSLMQVSRDSKIPVARLEDYEVAIMSPAYPIFRVKDTRKILPEYLDMWFKRPEFDREAAFIAVGGVRGSMPWEEFVKMKLPVPTIEKQLEIVNSYKAITERIALKQKINDNLIDTTDTIFFKMFLENKPVATISFTDIVQLMGGGTPKTDEDSFWNGNILFFTPKDISRSPFCISTEKHLTNEGLNNCSSRLYPPYTTFVTCRGTVGNLALAGVPMAMNQSCYALKGKNDFPALFVFSFTRYVIATMKKKASGAVFSALVTRDFEMEKVFEPNFEDAILFEKRVEPLFAQILANTNEIQQLLDLQNALLTQLSSR